MKLSEQIDPVYLLSSLNGERDFGRERRRDAVGPIKARKMADGEWEGLFAAADEDYRQASQILIAELRGLVDQWLDSGRRTDGVEEPKARTLDKAESAYRAMTAWALSHKPMVLSTIAGELIVTVGWSERRTDGQDDPKADAKDEARRIFVLMMDSPVKYALFKCGKADCGRYYILEKPRKVYKLGTYCPDHRRRVSALRGTKEKRELERRAGLEIAANALSAWPGLSERTQAKHKTAKGYIASKLSHLGLTAKWVTRNLSEIENRSKGDNHAKS
jgi:hypothetical protein